MEDKFNLLKNCGNCEWFKPSSEVDGVCIFNPPVHRRVRESDVGDKYSVYGAFPSVKAGMRCAQHKEKSE